MRLIEKAVAIDLPQRADRRMIDPDETASERTPVGALAP
jgi:hypothetical protein